MVLNKIMLQFKLALTTNAYLAANCVELSAVLCIGPQFVLRRPRSRTQRSTPCRDCLFRSDAPGTSSPAVLGNIRHNGPMTHDVTGRDPAFPPHAANMRLTRA